MKRTLSFCFCLAFVLIFAIGLVSCGGVEFKVDFVVDGQVYSTVNTGGGEVIKMPNDPEKEGFKFEGWYWDEGEWQRPFTANSLLDTPLSSNMCVYAKWMHNHVSSDWIIDKAATCTAEGARHKECTECKTVLESEVISKADHTPVIDAAVPATETKDGLTEGSHCSACGTVIVAQQVVEATLKGVDIHSNTMTLEGSVLSVSVSNDTEIFSFWEDIVVSSKATYVVATNVACTDKIDSKTGELEIGDNRFYILVTNGSDMKLYTVNVRRRPMYTVSFNANGGTAVQSQTVEEGSLATEPITTRAGYTFIGWEYDFATSIVADTVIKAKWTANTDTAYKIEYYYENLTKTGYDAPQVENKSGTTDMTVSVTPGTVTGFTLNTTKSKLSGNLNGDGSQVLKVYYTRNTYTVSVTGEGGTVAGIGKYPFGTEVALSQAIDKLGYEFKGWYVDGELVSVADEYSCEISGNIVAKYEAVAEMANFKFTSTDITCTITGIKDKTVKEIIIPDYVTSISAGAFSGCSSLESITLPFVGGSRKSASDTYQYPLGYIFGTSGYTGGVSTKQYYYGSSTSSTTYDYYYIPASLKSVKITGGNILYGAFYYCRSLTSVEIGDSVTSIGSSAFYNCTSLTSVEIPDSVTSIGSGAFSACYKLVEVINKSSLNIEAGSSADGYVGYYAKEVHNGESKIVDKNGYLFYTYGGTNYLLGYKGTDTELILPENYNGENYEIYKYAFAYCTSLTSVEIGDSVTSIGSSAFSGCSSLESITLPFVGESRKSASDTYQYPLGYIFGTSGYTGGVSTEQYYYGSSTSSTTSTTYYIPASLKSVRITGGNILRGAFSSCSSLTSVEIGDSVTSIGYAAFSGCSSLKSITLPFVGGSRKSASDTYQYPFGYIFGTSGYTGGVSTEQHYYGSSTSSTTSATYYIPASLKSVKITGGNILHGAFYNCSSLTSVEIGDSVTSIGSSAFYNCTSLTSVEIGDSVTSIGYWAFRYCTRLTSVEIGDSVTSIGSSAFYNCTSLTSVYITDIESWCKIQFLYYESNPLYYAHNLYLNGSLLTELVIPDSVTSIGEGAFLYCTSLTSVEIGDSVTSMGASAFYNTGYYNDDSNWINGVLYIGNHLIEAEDSIRGSYTIREGTKTIAGSAFSYCTSLTSVVIPDSVTSIGEDAFRNCTNLTSVEIGNSVESIGKYAFFSCTSLTSVTFKNTTGWWYSSSSTATSGTSISSSSLANKSTAAEYLTYTYVGYYWKRG